MGRPDEGQIGQVVESLLGATAVDPSCAQGAVENGGDLEVYQLGRGQVVADQALAGSVAVPAVVDQRRCQD